MTGPRKRYPAFFRARVALEAAKQIRTLAELSGRYRAHFVQIGQWKKLLLDGIESLFRDGCCRDCDESRSIQAEVYEQIGSLKMELEWLKKNTRFYFYCISSMHAGTCFLGITCVFYCFWHLRTAPTSKRRPETAESLEKARFSRECRKNGSFQGLKFPETIRFHKHNSSNDLSLDRGLIQ